MSSHIKDVSPEELSTEDSLRRYKVTRLVGFSMFPTLQENDVLFLQIVPPAEIRVGDLIVFNSKNKDKTICHRVVAKKLKKGKWFFKEKGDNCFNGSRISEDMIIARVKDFYRGRKHFIAYSPLLARFNIVMAFVFKFIVIARLIKKKVFPNWKIGFIFRPFFRSINKLNRLGNKNLGARFNPPNAG